MTHFQKLKAKVLNLAPKILIPLGLLVIAVAFFSRVDAKTPEELLREARQARLEARQGHCEAIGQKVAACYAGDMTVCEALPKSVTWFTGEYGEIPELACSTAPDPLVYGDVQQ